MWQAPMRSVSDQSTDIVKMLFLLLVAHALIIQAVQLDPTSRSEVFRRDQVDLLWDPLNLEASKPDDVPLPSSNGWIQKISEYPRGETKPCIPHAARSVFCCPSNYPCIQLLPQCSSTTTSSLALKHTT